MRQTIERNQRDSPPLRVEILQRRSSHLRSSRLMTLPTGAARGHQGWARVRLGGPGRNAATNEGNPRGSPPLRLEIPSRAHWRSAKQFYGQRRWGRISVTPASQPRPLRMVSSVSTFRQLFRGFLHRQQDLCADPLSIYLLVSTLARASAHEIVG